ncbi:MAG: NUDIX hydrolase [Propionibacteriaceae bacterium]|jgi:8-oxo-dGTP diphosphatase|nr:NUDIX hydrolase [Propionibacteriaceae bacterium]
MAKGPKKRFKEPQDHVRSDGDRVDHDHQPEAVEVWAAGAVVVDQAGLIAVVHRPKYNDWTLPKGKAEPGESLAQTAVREVAEETGAVIELEAPLMSLCYTVDDKFKVVRWWRSRLISLGERTAPAKEIDAVAWLTPAALRDRLDYVDEWALVAEALGRSMTD